jgi:hypothetical protein
MKGGKGIIARVLSLISSILSFPLRFVFVLLHFSILTIFVL